MAHSRGEREHAICQNCRRPFTRRVADRKRGWAKCCSKSCAAALKFRKTATPPPAPRHFTASEMGALRTSGPEFRFSHLDYLP